MANEGSTKPTHTELARCIAYFEPLKGGRVHDPDNASVSVTDAAAYAKHETERVRGLLQRIVSAHTLYNNRLTGETMAILGDTIREAAEESKPEPNLPNFRQHSSLVGYGAESADIGKLDGADEDENVLCVFCPTRSPDGSMKACLDAGKCLHPDKPVGHFALAAASSTNCTTCGKQILTASTAVASGMMPKLHEYFCTCTQAGSAETGGEKA